MAIEEDDDDIIETNDEADDENDDHDEDDSDSGDDSSDKGKKSEKEEEFEIVKDAPEKDERIAVQGKKHYKDESPEEKRARRKREREQRKHKNYVTRRELDNYRKENIELRKHLERLNSVAEDFGKRESSRDELQLEQAIQAQKTLYATAEAQFNKAITEGNGAAATEAQRVMLDASGKFTQLAGLKNRNETEKNSPARQESEKETTTRVPPEVINRKTLYTQRWLAKNDWFDPGASDEDSKLAKEIDAEVAAEGFEAHTKEYWDELDARLRDELPHLYESKEKRKQNNVSPKPRQVNGSQGADSATKAKKSVKIPERVVKMAKDAGQWDDPRMRKIFISNWKAINGNGAVS